VVQFKYAKEVDMSVFELLYFMVGDMLDKQDVKDKQAKSTCIYRRVLWSEL